jgi:O-glycosyl hydrolase
VPPIALINPIPHHTFRGWGSSAAGSQDWFDQPVRHLDHKQALDTFYGMGQTFVRVAFRHDLTYDAQGRMHAYHDLVRILKTAQEHGVKDYILAIWSPPIDMKEPAVAQGFVDQNKNGQCDPGEPVTRLRDGQEEAYCKWYVKAIQNMQSQGLGLPLNVSVQNEPNEIVAYEGCYYKPDQYARVVKTMRRTLDDAGLQKIQIIGPDSNYGPVTYMYNPKDGIGYLGGTGFAFLESDPAYNKALGGYAWHSYNMSNMYGLAEGVARFPKECWMTENCGGPGGTDELTWAIAQGTHLIADFVLIPNNYWCYWNTIDLSGTTQPGDATLIVGYKDGSVRLTKTYHLLKNLWTTVRPGWTVHTVQCSDPEIRTSTIGQDHSCHADTVAFRSPDGKATAMLIANVHAQPKTLKVRGFLGQKATALILSATEDMDHPQNLPITNVDQLVVELPAKSLTLIRSE